MKLHINKEILKVFGGSLAFTIVLSIGARQLNKKFTCQIEELHAHRYTAIGGLERYAISDSTIYELMLKSRKDIKYLSEDDATLINYLDNNDLFIIDENLEKIKKDLEDKKDFTEYEHDVEKTDKLGKKYKDKYWSRDYLNCNGNARDCYYIYEAYKIENNQLIKSNKVDNILDIKDEYPYIKINYYEIVKGDIYQVDIKNKVK